MTLKAVALGLMNADYMNPWNSENFQCLARRPLIIVYASLSTCPAGWMVRLEGLQDWIKLTVCCLIVSGRAQSHLSRMEQVCCYQLCCWDQHKIPKLKEIVKEWFPCIAKEKVNSFRGLSVGELCGIINIVWATPQIVWCWVTLTKVELLCKSC